MTALSRAGVCLIVVGSLVACGGGETGPLVQQLEVGVAYGAGDFSVPDSVAVSEEFEVSVTTYGSSCHSFAKTDVARSADSTVITPYDSYTYDGSSCGNDLHEIAHDVPLSIDAPGVHRVIASVRLFVFSPDSTAELRDSVIVY